MNYQEFLEYIYIRYSGNVKLGLERIHSILEKMGNPEKKMHGFHVAGTNGKGSTSAMIESLSLLHGKKTGLNTSPHLVDYKERFRINRQEIETAELLNIHDRFADIFLETEASFFEITTAIAFYYFWVNQVETAVIEVGLGGRLDGTNPFKSDISLITSIAIDHPKSLGDTVEKIAYEKAGIIKEKQPVVIGSVPAGALAVILEQVAEKSAFAYVYGRDFFVENVRLTAEGTVFDYLFPQYGLVWKNLRVNLLGAHQALNAGYALTAFYLYQQLHAEKFELSLAKEALEQVIWQGRMQIIARQPLLIIDGAHNDQGVEELIKNMKIMYPEREIHLVVAILRDKDLYQMIRALGLIAKHLYISKNKSERAADLEEQVAAAKSINADYSTHEDVITAVRAALERASKDAVVLVTGSLYTIAEVIKNKENLLK